MKFKFCLIIGFALAFASCSGKHHRNNNIDTLNTDLKPEDTGAAGKPVVNMAYCFYSTDGKKHQDTTKVSFRINGNVVAGDMSWLPKEKDRRKGTLAGTLNGNAIKALWTYGQEGSTDTLTVEFQLRGNKLAQKPYRYDAKTGKEQTNAIADYTVIYNMINCH